MAVASEMLDEAAITKPHLEQLEQVVRDGLQSFMAVGLALIEIREARGYILRGFDTFESYCQETFGFTARHGRRMIQAAQTASEVANATGVKVRNAGVARALAPVRHDPSAIRHIKARLESRGESFGRAPAAVITGILSEVMTKPKQRRAMAKGGICPWCNETPRAYRCIDGIFQCGYCGEDVMITAAKLEP